MTKRALKSGFYIDEAHDIAIIYPNGIYEIYFDRYWLRVSNFDARRYGITDCDFIAPLDFELESESSTTIPTIWHTGPVVNSEEYTTFASCTKMDMPDPEYSWGELFGVLVIVFVACILIHSIHMTT